MAYISFILKPCDLKFGMLLVKTLLYFKKPADYTYYEYFFDFLDVWSEWVVFYLGQNYTLSLYMVSNNSDPKRA